MTVIVLSPHGYQGFSNLFHPTVFYPDHTAETKQPVAAPGLNGISHLPALIWLNGA